MNEYELSFLDILADSSLKFTRYKRNDDEDELSTTLNELDNRISDVLTSLAAMSDKVNVLNNSYYSLDSFLDDLEEATLGELSFFLHFYHT